jgi:hypothetical protein
MNSFGWKANTDQCVSKVEKQQERDLTSNEKENEKLQSGRDSIDNEVLHALKNASGHDDPLDDGGQPLLREHYIRSRAGRIGGFR